MGSNSGTGTGVIDCCVGTIVWVRRRNGSWWPGKIVGSDELSASHLMSPRSGTPVKLLGREDASVDWYNLEKSKRVKAFRCGEFDDCIERAEASQGIPPKKREKYARREDAIFHALELEKQSLDEKYGKIGSSSDAKKCKLPDGVKNELATSPECLEQGNRKHAKPKSHQHVNPKSHRMRGLKDFGLGTALSKSSENPAFDDSDHALSNGARTAENISHANGKDFSDKRKSSHDELAEESLIKRRDKRSPLVRVLESSEKVLVSHSLQPDGGSVPLSKSSECLVNKEMDLDQMEISTFKFEESNCSHPAGEENASGSTEDTETDSAESDMDGAAAALSDDVETIELRPKTQGRSEAKMEHGCTSSDEPDDMALASEIPTPISASVEVSKWQMKGKRNKRGLTKRYPNATSTRVSKGSSRVSEKKTRTQMVGYGSRGSNGISESGWNIRTQIGDSMLVDVDLKVQSSYQKEHVPMISLMSKFNRKAIIGHPIQVEKLENGSTENLLTAAADYISPEALDSNTSVPPVWRTTNCRAPRPRSSSTLDGEDRNRQVISRKPNASMMRENISRAPRPKKLGKSARKTPKRLGLSSSLKIRTLSSIGQQQKHSNEPKHGLLMKPASGPTTVACIPVKLVFSRLYEELVNRHQ